MEKQLLEELKENLKDIKKEGSIEDIKVEELEEVEINKPTKRDFKTSLLKKGAIAAAVAVALASTPTTSIMDEPNPYTVEAKTKKDKKKPKIKFSGKSKMTVNKNKVIKIPKTTAKDNKDGNVTKKLKITVKKGKKSYKSIASKIKKNKKVKFSSTGKYVITYTVKDKAGNKATKKRYITVVNPKSKNTTKSTTEKTTQTPTTTQMPTTQTPTTTEIPTTTEKPTTEQPTTEKTQNIPILEKPVVGDGYYGVNRVKVGDRMYNIINDPDFESVIEKTPTECENITFTIENDYSTFLFSKDSGLLENYNYLSFLGEMTALDLNGLDMSEGIAVYAPYLDEVKEYNYIYLYVEDTAVYECERNSIKIPICLYVRDFLKDYEYDDGTFGSNYHMLSKDPLVYGFLRSSKNKVISSSKKLELIKK